MEAYSEHSEAAYRKLQKLLYDVLPPTHPEMRALNEMVEFIRYCPWGTKQFDEIKDQVFDGGMDYDGEGSLKLYFTLATDTFAERFKQLLAAYFRHSPPPQISDTLRDPNQLIFAPVPEDPSLAIDRLAHDLAWGVYHKLWENEFKIFREFSNWSFEYENNFNLQFYIYTTWLEEIPDLKLLDQLGWIRHEGHRGGQIHVYQVTSSALQLSRKPITASIFISYRRKQSSALALLIVARFKEHGHYPYLDMGPEPEPENRLVRGEDWEVQLKRAVQSRDNFIVLMGPETFDENSYVPIEIGWALDAERKIRILPLWHHGFNPAEHLPPNIDTRIRELVNKTQAYEVEKENPKQYNATLDELLMDFGIVV